MIRILAAFVAAMVSTDAFAADDSANSVFWSSPKTEAELCQDVQNCDDVAALQKEVKQLQNDLAKRRGVNPGHASQADLDALAARVTALEQALKNLQQPAAPTQPAPQVVDLGPIEREIQELRDQIAKIPPPEKVEVPQIRGGIGFAGEYVRQVGFNRPPDAVTSPNLTAIRPEADLRVDYVDRFVIQLGGFGTFGSDATKGGGGEFYAGHWLGADSIVELGGTVGYSYHAVYGAGTGNTSAIAEYSAGNIGLRAGLEPVSGFNIHAEGFLGIARANDGYRADLQPTVLQPGIMLGLTYYFPGPKPEEKKAEPSTSPEPTPESAPANSEQAPAAVPAPDASSGEISPEARRAISEGIAESEDDRILVIVPARQ